jgi:hypothetical protein
MTAVIVGIDPKTGAVQRFGDVVVTAGVFT